MSMGLCIRMVERRLVQRFLWHLVWLFHEEFCFCYSVSGRIVNRIRTLAIDMVLYRLDIFTERLTLADALQIELMLSRQSSCIAYRLNHTGQGPRFCGYLLIQDMLSIPSSRCVGRFLRALSSFIPKRKKKLINAYYPFEY